MAEDAIVVALLDIKEAAVGEGIEPMLVGASSMKFAPEVKSASRAFRLTEDVDIAVAVPGWDVFERVRQALDRKKFKIHPKKEHRMGRDGVLLDVIPFGDSVAPKGEFTWPESGQVMNVLGYPEAWASARDVSVADNFSFRAVSVPGFILLKIAAFLDRSGRGDMKGKDDALDIDYWLEDYASERHEEKYALKIDFALAGAHLLGLDVAKISSPACNGFVERFMTQSEDLYSKYADAVARSAEAQDRERGKKKREEAVRQLKAFAGGFRSYRSGE